MSDAQPTPSADQTASSEPRLAQHETNLATNPIGDGSSAADKPSASYTEMASNAASTAANTASTTAANMKDNVFSMFGGGAKKERKEDTEVDEPSGSSKAKKEAENEDDVSLPERILSVEKNTFEVSKLRPILTSPSYTRMMPSANQMFTSSLWFALRNRSRLGPMKSKRSPPLRCGPSFSDSTGTAENGKNVVQEMCDC